MQYSMIAAAALVAGASANYNGSISYTTEIVDSYTTFCPYSTQITHGASVYTVTEATTLTITNCPCTLTKPVSSQAAAFTAAPVVSAAAPVVSASAAPAVVVSTSETAVVAAASTVEVAAASPAVSTAAPVAPVAATVAPIFYANSTTVAPAATAAPSAPVSSPQPFKGAAGQLSAPAGLIAAVALAAFFL